MKNKKLFTTLLSTVTAAACSLSVFAGCNNNKGCPNSDDGEHKYREQANSVVPSTCTTQGSHTLVCGLCGDVVTESLPLDPEAHNYGDWAIDTPTEETTGLATKTCTYDSSHVLSVTLPKLVAGGTGYDLYQTVKPATAVEAGTLHLELNHTAGKISFDVTIPKRNVTTVEDAVELGSSLGSLIRLSKGRAGVTYYDDVVGKNQIRYSPFECEYGENFTHITDEGNREQYWFSRDDAGRPYGVFVRTEQVDVAPPDATESQWETITSDPSIVNDASEDNLKGFQYLPGVTDNLSVYGAEDALATYYNLAMVARDDGTLVNYDENITKNSDGSIDAWFSYSHYEIPNFGRYKMEFHLNPTGVITTLKLTTKIIRAYMIEEDATGQKLFYPNGDVVFAEEYDRDPNTSGDLYEMDGKNIVIDGVKTDANGNELKDKNGNTIPRYKPKTGVVTDAQGKPVTDKNGNPVQHYQPATVAERRYYSDDHQEVSTRILEYTERTLKTEDDEEPENPYPPDTLYIHSFDVRYRGEVVGSEGASIPSNTGVEFEIVNIKPVGTANLDYDPLDVYVRTESRDVPLTMSPSDNEYKIYGAFMTDSHKVMVNAQRSGDVTLVLKTRSGLYETTLTLHVQKAAPSDLFPEVYAYNVVNNKKVYGWQLAPAEPDDPPGEDEEPIEYFTVYEGQSFYVRATCDPLQAAYSDTTFELGTYYTYDFMSIENHVMLNGEEVTKVTVDNAGTYDDMYLSYVKYDEKRGEYVSNGTASGNFRLIVLSKPATPEMAAKFKGTYTAQLQYMEVQGKNQPATAEVAFSFTTDWCSGDITVKVGDGTTKYKYSVNEAEGTVTATYVSGPNGSTYEFTFNINEAYDIEMSHPTGYPDDEPETVVLTIKKAE